MDFVPNHHHCHDIKLDRKTKGGFVLTYQWFAKAYFANIYSGDLVDGTNHENFL